MRQHNGSKTLALIALAILLFGPFVVVSAGADDDDEPDVPLTQTVAADDEDEPAAKNLTQSLAGDGVAVQTLCTNCNNADLSLAGLGNNNVEVTCDGLTVPAGLAQIYLLSIMPGTMIDTVAVNKGAGGSNLSGGAVGGQIEIGTRKPEPGYVLNLSADVGDYDWKGGKLDLSGTVGKFGGALAVSTGTSDLVDANGDGFPNLPSFDRYTVDARAEVDFTPRQRWIFGANSYVEDQKDGPAAVFYGSDPQNGDFEAKFRGYNLENVDLERRQYDTRYEGKFDNGGDLQVGGAWSKREMDIEETERLSDFFIPTYFIEQETRLGSASYSQPIGTRAVVSGGLSYTENLYGIVDVRFNQFQPIPPEEWLTYELTERVEESGAWGEGRIAFGPKVELTVGLRYTEFSYTDSEDRDFMLELDVPEGDAWLPRGALVWKPTSPIQLRFSAGKGFRVPQPIYEEVCCGRRYRNNRGIRPEYSESYGVEFSYQPQPRFKLGASVFRTDFEDLVIKLATLSYQYQNTYQNANVTEARYDSLSFEARYDMKRWFGFSVSATWLDADNRAPDDEVMTLIDFFNFQIIEKVFVFEKIPYLADRRGAANVTIRPGLGFNITLGTAYTGPMEIQWFDVDNPDFDLGGSQVQDEPVTTEDFWVTSASVSKTFKIGLTAFVGVDNIGDYVQSDLGDPQFDFNWGPLRGRYAYFGLSYNLAR